MRPSEELSIVTINENKSFLETPSHEVSDINDDLKSLVEKMKHAMKKANGIGLAAPQIGKSLRLFIVDMKTHIEVFINPEITWKSSQTETDFEGCLSIPHVFGKVKRFKKIKVKYKTIDNSTKTLTAKGLIARIIQHENDHIDGILFTSKATDIYRDDTKQDHS